MARNLGLGKGLGALLSVYDEELENQQELQVEEKPVEKPQKSGGGVDNIDIAMIVANPHQPRKTFEQGALEELSASIKEHGIIQPIVLNKTADGKYMIIAGERRWRASKLAGITEMPAVVKNYTDKQVAEISIIENLQREDLNDIEVARGIEVLMKTYKLTQEQVSVRLSKNRSTIANLLRLLTLPKQILDLIETGRLSAGHARCLIGMDSIEKQLELANKSTDGKITVRDLEKTVREINNPDSKLNKKATVQSLELKELIHNMQKVFATKVSALGNDNKGRIFIDYYNKDDLDRIVSLVEKLK